MDEKRRMYAKSVIMKGLESSDYSSYESEAEDMNFPIPRHPSIQFEDYTSEDDVQFTGIKKVSPIHMLLTNWNQLYPH